MADEQVKKPDIKLVEEPPPESVLMTSRACAVTRC
jgi:hypothetical protein